MFIQYFKLDNDDPWFIKLKEHDIIMIRCNECEWIVPGTIRWEC